MIGEIKYRDLNGDGQITAEERTIIGDTNPKFTYGITNNLSYKDFSLSFMLQGSYGNDIFNANLMDIQLANEGNITTDAYAGRRQRLLPLPPHGPRLSPATRVRGSSATAMLKRVHI